MSDGIEFQGGPDSHKAKRWADENYPDAPPILRAVLILAYGAGLDAGLAEAQEIVGRQGPQGAPYERD